TGETPRRCESLEFAEDEAARPPRPQRLYLCPPGPEGEGPAAGSAMTLLHPLVVFDPDTEEVLFFNARRGQQRTEYLSYTTGRVAELPDAGEERRELLARVLGVPVGEAQVERWAARSHAGERAAGPAPATAARREIGEFQLLGE